MTFERQSASACWVSAGVLDEEVSVLEEAVHTLQLLRLDFKLFNIHVFDTYFQVFIRYPYYTQIARDVKTTRLQFLGTAGGLMGLCMGFSIVSIVELFYHFIRLIVSLVD